MAGTMTADPVVGDVAPGRLTEEEIQQNFQDIRPPFTPHQAVVEADRCYFCYDAPCVQACPTGIDVPLFIRQIATGNLQGSGETILKSNNEHFLWTTLKVFAATSILILTFLLKIVLS